MKPAADSAARVTRAFLVLAVAIPLLFAAFTEHRWEDYYITLRQSRNLAEGHGLVFNPGERVHGFTSPLGVLLPAALLAVTGSDVWTLLLFRLLCTAAFAGGGLALLDAAARVGASTRARLLLAALYLCEPKSVSFTISGMETALMLLFTGLGLRNVVLGAHGRALPTGLVWAGLLWTRPDGCVYIAALGLAHLAFADRPRRDVLASLLRAAAITAAAYAPWFLWAWSYYGSPVPHTVQAKASASSYAFRFELITGHAERVFAPPNGGWPRAVSILSTALAALCPLVVALRPAGRLARAGALVGAGLLAYLLLAPPFPWYYPPVAMALLVGVSGVADAAWRSPRPAVRAAATATSLLLVLALLAQLVVLAYELRLQQREVEDAHRTRIGRWLREVVGPDERVFLEPIGYIGYYSGVRIVDTWGLVSPEVVRLRREGHQGFDVLIERLQPEWLLLRPMEAITARATIERAYDPVRVFDIGPRLDQLGWFPGRDAWFEYDRVFVAFRRR